MGGPASLRVVYSWGVTMADMSISEFMDRHVPREAGLDFRDRRFERYFDGVAKEFQEPGVVTTILAVILWQILMETVEYLRVCVSLELPAVIPHPRVVFRHPQEEPRVVAHGDEGQPQFNLLVLSRFFQGEPRSERMWPDGPDLILAFERWRKNRLRNVDEALGVGRLTQDRHAQLRSLINLIDHTFAAKAMEQAAFHIAAARLPDLEYTSIPNTPWPVFLTAKPTATATAGAVVRHKAKKQVGVTISTHLLLGGTLANPVGWGVDVNGQSGTVVSCDPISDSSFVELAHIGPPTHAHRTTSGLLPGPVAPAHGTVGYFEGCATRGKASGQVTSVNVNIFNTHYLIQQHFDLNRLTNPGDSGCVLLDAGGHILGFAMCRTRPTSNPSFSTWIWADSVFTFHNLQPF